MEYALEYILCDQSTVGGTGGQQWYFKKSSLNVTTIMCEHRKCYTGGKIRKDDDID